MTNPGRRGSGYVEIQRVLDPIGRSCVLIQLADGFVVLQPGDARRVAEAILTVADDIEFQA